MTMDNDASLPRTRGDDPHSSKSNLLLDVFAPHARG